MKTSISKITSAILLFVAFSFSTINAQKKEINTEKSTVQWKGYKVTGSHEGFVSIKSGTLDFESDKLTGGEIVIDMTSITCTDLSGGIADKFVGHLNSDDFFGVANYPTATLVFTEVVPGTNNSYKVIGDITIKGKTEKITFDLLIEDNKASTSFKVDRTKFDIKYGSASFFDGLKNKAIYNEFDLVVSLAF